MAIVSVRWLAAFAAAAFMITISPFEASAQRSRLDDWLGFDQSGDGFDQPGPGRATVREAEAQPERGFPTLAKENVAAARNAIKQ